MGTGITSHAHSFPPGAFAGAPYSRCTYSALHPACTGLSGRIQQLHGH